MKKDKIYLNYDPKWQSLVRLSAHLKFINFAIFMFQIALLISNRELFEFIKNGYWISFLASLSSNPNPFILIKINFIALRVIYIIGLLGYGVALWNVNRSAVAAYLSFGAVALPIILTSQVFQLALVPLSQIFKEAIFISGPMAEATMISCLVNTKTIYVMTEFGDIFVNLILFDGILITWAILAHQGPHPKYHVIWIIVLTILPIGRIIGLEILGLINAFLTGIFMLIIGFFMLKFEPAESQSLHKADAKKEIKL